MASADFLRFVVTMLRFEFVYSYAPARPPRVSVITFTSYICCIYALNFGQYRTLFCLANSSISKRLFLCSFCSSDRGFASDFFQTPPHDGRPCLWLTVPTAMPVADFHRQVITRAGHTSKNLPLPGGKGEIFCFLMQGASPLASPAFNRLRHLQSLPSRYPVPGEPEVRRKNDRTAFLLAVPAAKERGDRGRWNYPSQATAAFEMVLSPGAGRASAARGQAPPLSTCTAGSVSAASGSVRECRGRSPRRNKLLVSPFPPGRGLGGWGKESKLKAG